MNIKTFKKFINEEGEVTQLVPEELISAVRTMIMAEYDAIKLYTQLSSATDHPLVKEVLADVIEEEKVHAGEFLKLLLILSPNEGEKYNQGAEETKSKQNQQLEFYFELNLTRPELLCYNTKASLEQGRYIPRRGMLTMFQTTRSDTKIISFLN
jgi:rubrerythrin